MMSHILSVDDVFVKTHHQQRSICILPKSECPGCPDSADDFEFSAERSSENAKSIKIMLFAELLTVISPSYVQSLQ